MYLSLTSFSLTTVFEFVILTFMIITTQIEVDLLCGIVDLCMGLMELSNIIALFLLSRDKKSMLNHYDSKISSGEVLRW